MIRLFLSAFLISCQAFGATWYASTNGSGDGSLESPWDLQTALSSASIQPGDTLLLRGGTYSGPFKSTLAGQVDSYTTVRSYPGEWATIQDGYTGTLKTALDVAEPYTTTHDVDFDGDEHWIANEVIRIGEEMCKLNSFSGGTWDITRGWNGTVPATHSMDSPVLLCGHILDHSGSYVKFMDFAITSILSTNRSLLADVEADAYAGLNLDVGIGNKAINLIIYNVGHPGIGFWNQRAGGEINGCLIWGTGVYDHGGVWTRGSAIYTQNDDNEVYIKNNIIFRNFTGGIKAYATAGVIKGFRIINNITMMSPGVSGIAVFNVSEGATNNAMWTNYCVLDTMTWGYTGHNNTNMSCVGNTIVAGPMAEVKHQGSGVYRKNTLLFDQALYPGTAILNLFYTEGPKANLVFDWDENAYFSRSGATSLFGYQTSDVDPPGKLTFANWQSTSGWDENSTFSANWPDDYVSVRVFPLDYDSDKWHVAVVSTSGETSMTLNIGTECGFVVGQRYRLRDAQNYFNPIVTATYTGGTITLPLNLTDVSEISGTVTHFTNEHTNAREPGLFNAFVLERLPTSTAGTLRVNRIIGR